jgi:integrase
MSTNIKYLTKSQVDKLISLITDPRDRAMLTLLYCYGLRRGELCNLKLDDIDIDNNRIYIKALKNGISGSQYLTNACIERIKDYLEIRKNINPNLPYLFLGKYLNTTKLDGGSVRRIYIKYAKMANLPKELMHPHCLRHALGTALLSSGFDLGYVKSILRHRSITSTIVYANIMDEKKLAMQKQAFESAEYLAKF